MVTMYDSLGLKDSIVLDLSMLEGAGLVTHDESKSQIIGSLHGSTAPWWPATIGSGHYGLGLFLAWNHYVDAPAADTGALNFTATDYSLAVWIKWLDTTQSEIVMGRYEVSVKGWELYLTKTAGVDYMTLRHHHAGGATTRTACFSIGWAENTWALFGVSRVGATAQHYRNGQAVATTVQAGGLIDPETNANRDLVIGTRYTKDANWYNGYMARPRAWSRELSAYEHRAIFELERGEFGL